MTRLMPCAAQRPPIARPNSISIGRSNASSSWARSRRCYTRRAPKISHFGEAAAERLWQRERELRVQAAHATLAAHAIERRRQEQLHAARRVAWDEQSRLDKLELEALEEQEGPLSCGDAVALMVRQAEAKEHLLGPVGSWHAFTHWLLEQ